MREVSCRSAEVYTHPNLMKKILQISLLTIVALGVGLGIWKQMETPSDLHRSTLADESKTSVAPLTGESEVPQVVVTYFTTNVRCKSCLSIEALTRETVEERFAEELAGKTLVFQTINIDLPENKHFIEQYQLSFKTVVLSSMKEGEQAGFMKMDKVWELLHTPETFKNYLAEGIAETFAALES